MLIGIARVKGGPPKLVWAGLPGYGGKVKSSVSSQSHFVFPSHAKVRLTVTNAEHA